MRYGVAAGGEEKKAAAGDEKLVHSLDILEAFTTLKLEVSQLGRRQGTACVPPVSFPWGCSPSLPPYPALHVCTAWAVYFWWVHAHAWTRQHTRQLVR